MSMESSKNTTAENGNGYYLRWSRLTKSVVVKPIQTGLVGSSVITPTVEGSSSISKGSATKVILNQISAYARPNELLALMGPSGSGKTSLLNTLCGRSAIDSGVITINGYTVNGPSMKRLMSKVAYVKQTNIFFDHLTVRDQLAYTALLRLPANQEKGVKQNHVNRIIKMLRLTKVAQSPIFLCSGGEKKRVNIGTELLTNPSVVMLDEPTSGLDSTSAVSLLNLLAKLARDHGKTVVTSIHQPSSAVFRSFDRLLMLADGHVVYFGTPVGSLSYLREMNLACPDGYNAADHWMDLLVVDSTLLEEKKEQEKTVNAIDVVEQGTSPMDSNRNESKTRDDSEIHRKNARQLLIEKWDGEAVAEAIDSEANEIDEYWGRLLEASSSRSKYNTSWLTQFLVLMHRSLRSSQSKIFTPLNFIKSAGVACVVGLLFLRLDLAEKYVDDISSYYFFTMTFWVFDSMFTALHSFPSERDVILKERSSASYHLSAYFMAKTSSEGPARMVLPFVYMAISFWLASPSPKISVFFATTGCSLLSVFAGESFGLLIGASVYDMQRALTLMTVVAMFMLLQGGFFVDNIPSFIRWGKYLSPFKYSYDASLHVIFKDPVKCDGSGALSLQCAQSTNGMVATDDLLDHFGVESSLGFNVGLLIVMILAPRYFAYRALLAKKEGERT